MRKIILWFGLLLLIVFQGIAQPSIPVDPLTGRAEVSVALGDISYGFLSVPISLSYNSSGVMPQQAGGTAGVNWNLNAGGRITRDVRGLPDDYTSTDVADTRKGWLLYYAQQINDFTFTSDDNLLVCSDELNDWTFLHDLSSTRDSEPDMFTFSAPGLSGQFVFGADKLPKLIPYQDVKIEFNPATLNGAIASITITKNDGTKYFFGATESITRAANRYYNTPVTQFLTEFERYRKPLKFISVWSLQSISSPTGATITLCYGDQCNAPEEPDHYEKIKGSERRIELSSVSSTATSAPYKQYYIQDIIETKELVSIYSAGKRAEFFYTYEGALNELKFSWNGSTNTKNFKLLYIEARNASEQRGKMFLKQINETNFACETFPMFQFEYYDLTYGAIWATTTLIFNSPEIKQDYWGYFNDLAVSKNPTLYYYGTKSDAERYRFYPIPGLTETAKINGADRSVNPAKIISGSLKKITYPTGGQATITYEPNQYHDVEASTSQYGPGLRVKQVTIQDNVVEGSENIVYDYEYKLEDNKSSGKWVYRSVFGFHDVSNFYGTLEDQSRDPAILYERAKVKRSGRGETVYEYYLPGTYPAVAVSDWTATQTKFARGFSSPCVSYGELKKHYFSHPFAYNMNYDFERGLIWKVTDYNAAFQKVQEKEYTYQRLGTPTILVKGLRFELLNGTSNLTTGASSSSNTYVFSKYSLLANIGKVVLTETVRTPDMSDLTKEIETASTYTYSSIHSMLSHVQTLNSDGSTIKTRFKYAKDFVSLTQPNASDPKSVMLKKLNDDFIHAAPVETISSVIIGGVETVTGASLTLYGSFPDSLNNARALPAEIRNFSGTTGYAEAVVSPATGSNQILSFSNSIYMPSSSIVKYDFAGNAISSQNQQRKKQSVHLGYKKTLPVAQFDNAASNEVVYDGFETYTGGGFDVVSAGLAYPPGWTGKKAVQLEALKFLERSSVAKGLGNYYRYSCWLNAAAPVQIAFKILNGTTVVETGTISYAASDVNTWKYFEGRILVSAANSTFKLRVEATGIVSVDDIAFYPESSSANLFTYDPAMGKTSESDSRGVSAFYEYDALGRLKFVKDQDKNLRQSVDYYYKVQPYPVVNSTFGASHEIVEVVKGATVTYNANTFSNCALSPLTYDWYVNDVKLGNNVTTFSYTYSLEQTYVLRLVVTHPSLGASSSSVSYDVKQISSGPLGATVNDASGTNAYAFCDANHTKNFTLALSGCYVLQKVDIRWYFMAGGSWTEYSPGSPVSNVGSLSTDGLSFSFDPVVAFNGITNLAMYSIRCDVSTTCPVTGMSSVSSYTRNISYNGNTQCQ